MDYARYEYIKSVITELSTDITHLYDHLPFLSTNLKLTIKTMYEDLEYKYFKT